MTQQLAFMYMCIARAELDCGCPGCASILFQNFFWEYIQVFHEVVIVN